VIKVWNLPGGIHPAENKAQSMQAPLGSISLPSEMVHPLGQHIGAPAEPTVAVGDKVLAGQLIASAKGFISANIHASTSGVVSAIEERPIVHPSGMDAPCIIITPDGLDQSIVFERSADYLALERDALLEKIRNAGITGMGGAGFPTSVKLNPRDAINTLIINGTECEPYITADDMLMQTRADDVVKGIELLAHLLGNPERVVIGIEDNKPDAIKAMQTAAQGSSVEVTSFPTKYPSGGEKQLIYILTGKEVPSGQLPGSIGIVLQNVGTTVAALEAVRDGKPLFERITTVVGEALGSQRNILVKLGTPIRHVLEQHAFDERKASRLIAGGPMMGFALESSDAPIVKSSNCILAPSQQELSDPPPAQACIRCGMCAEACPASLLPQQMYWYTLAEDYDKLDAHNLRDCIECGACSFVCPSNIPLVQYFRAGKGAMRQIAVEKEKSDRSRQRFEFRQERIVKAEAEKEAKRAARKLAAEAAKKKLAAAKAAGESKETPTASADPVATAMANAKAKTLSPAEQQAKLERALSSASSRVEKARASVATSEGDKQQRFEANLKQAELKQQEAQQKLDELKAAPVNSAPAVVDENDPVAAAIARAKAKMDMDPREKLASNIESLNKRLAKSEDKLAQAKSDGGNTVEALQTGLDKLKEKIATAEKELGELPAATARIPAAPAELDAASAAIERAKAKAAASASMSPEEKLKDQLTSMTGRIDKAQSKLAKAKSEGSDTADAMQLGVDKMLAKREKLRGELAAINPAALSELDATASAATKETAPLEQSVASVVEQNPEPVMEKGAAPVAPKDAATLAIEKAKAKAAASASMSPEEKLRDQLASMEKRLDKAQQRLEKATAEGDANVDAFRSAAEKLEGKLAATRSELEALS